MNVSDKEISQKMGYEVRQKTLRLLQEKGPDLEKVLLRLNEALDAKETKFFAHQGEVVNKRNVVAHNIRLQATKIGLDLHDAMPSQKHEHTGNIRFDSEILSAIITGLPEEFADAVCKSLSDIISNK